MRIIIAWVLLAAATVPAAADAPKSAVDAAKASLTGGATRSWIFERIEFNMAGDSKRCKAGEVWSFDARGVVTILKCSSGKLSTSESAWSIAQAAQALRVSVGADVYQLIIAKDEGSMKLRSPEPDGPHRAKDRVFTRSKD